MKPIAPCKDCEERQVGCHATCERYKEFQSANIERNKKIKEARTNEARAESFLAENAAKKKKYREKGGQL